MSGIVAISLITLIPFFLWGNTWWYFFKSL